MYFRDFQILGAIFQVGKVHASNGRTSIMSGEMHLENQVFHVKLKLRRYGLTKVIGVSGSTREAALNDRKKLHSIYRDALRANTNNIRDLAKRRLIRKMVFALIMLSYLLYSAVSISKIVYTGFVLSNVVLLLISLSVIVFMIIFRHKIIGVY